MVLLPRRYGWLTLCIGIGVAVLGTMGWRLQADRQAFRSMQARYERIQRGMTPEEVRSIMGCPPVDEQTDNVLYWQQVDCTQWVRIASESASLAEYVMLGRKSSPTREAWVDGDASVTVEYRHDHSIDKSLLARVPPWQTRAPPVAKENLRAVSAPVRRLGVHTCDVKPGLGTPSSCRRERYRSSILFMKTASLAAENEVEVWLRILHPDAELSPRVARAILGLSLPKSDIGRLHELSAKARAGTLTPEEHAQADTFERVGSILSTLKSKARQTLRRSRRGD